MVWWEVVISMVAAAHQRNTQAQRFCFFLFFVGFICSAVRARFFRETYVLMCESCLFHEWHVLDLKHGYANTLFRDWWKIPYDCKLLLYIHWNSRRRENMVAFSFLLFFTGQVNAYELLEKVQLKVLVTPIDFLKRNMKI